MDIEKIFNHVKVVSPKAIAEWCNENTEGLELLADVITTNRLKFVFAGTTDRMCDIEEHLKCETKGEYSEVDLNRWLLKDQCISFDASAFKTWYYKVWPQDEEDARTPEQRDNEFYIYVRNVSEVPAHRLKEWYRKDELRFDALVAVISRGDIEFRQLVPEMREAPEKNTIYIAKRVEDIEKREGVIELPNGLKFKKDIVSEYTYYIPSEKEGRGRELEVAQRLRTWGNNFRIDAESFKCWVVKSYSNDRGQHVAKSSQFMSDRLKIAVEISGKVYPDGWTEGDRASYSEDMKKIKNELEMAGIKNDKDGIHSWMSKIINPDKY